MFINFLEPGKKMNKKIIRLITTIILYSFNCYASMTTFEETALVITANEVDRFPAHTVTDLQPYVNGGLVFTYPTGLFTTTPIIIVTILAAPHASNITYTAEVCTENSLSAEVMVYQNNSGVITEAATSEVSIQFLAIGT